MLPWKFDADNIDVRDITPENIYQYAVVRTPAVEAFLKYGSDDRNYFVVAPKGLGKTFLLKVKSKFYRQNISGYKEHCIPSGDELVEKLTSIRVSFSREELGRFKRIETWEKTWELSLFTMILRNFNIDLPVDLKTIIGEARTLLDILSAFLRSRSSVDKLHYLVASSLRPRVADLHKQGVNQIAIFIDNIDEGIEEHGYNLKNATGTLSQDVWINAQLGMMKIVRDICQRHKHIKIFVSIRSEAFNNLGAQTALQYKDIASILTYTKTQIKEIFEQNIGITSPEQMAKPGATNPIERFVGFSSMDHRFVLDDGNPRREETFDFVFRHTFGRPREIVLMGSEIAKISVNERQRDEEAVREVVNSVSGGDLLQQLKREIIPYFEDEVFDRFCDLVRNNVISTKQAEKIVAEISTYPVENVFSYLYSIGLVGTTEYSMRQRCLIQRFLPVGQHSLSENVLPRASEYFVIHSSVDKTLKSKHGPHFYDRNNIIGDGLAFQEPKSSGIDPGSKVLHTHFGLDRDSLTLIVPELSRNKSIAIVQRPSKDDHELSQAKLVEVRTGKYDPVSFKVIHDHFSSSQIDDLLTEWERGENVLIYSERPEVVGRVLNASETITLWSGNFCEKAENEDLLPVRSLDAINSGTKSKVVYVCQRVINKKILTAIRNQIRLKALDELISVESSLVDRLEYKTSKFAQNDTLIYDVEAEEYGSIVTRERDGSKNTPSGVVRRTKSAKEQSFYEDRQRYLKEGIYRLTRIIKKVLTDQSEEELDDLYKLFFDIQIANLADKHSLRQIYRNRSESEVLLELGSFCHEHKQRFFNLGRFPPFGGSKEQYVEYSKRVGAFPDNKTFFQMARQSSLFTKSDVVLALQELMGIRELSNHYSVFICFSVRDEEFVKKISDSLKKRGIDAYFFKEAHGSGDIKSLEKKEIAERDKILFVASENSITSSECQSELSLGIRKRLELTDSTKAEAMKQTFVPITIDDYVWRVGEKDLETRLTNYREGWQNVEVIKQQVIHDFARFRNRQVDEEFERKVDDAIVRALLKGKGRKVGASRS